MPPLAKVSKTLAIASVVIASSSALAVMTATDVAARTRRAVQISDPLLDHVIRFDETPQPAPQAKFFTINAVLAKLARKDPATSGSGDVQLASLTKPDTATDEPTIGAAAADSVGPEPFGLFSFRAPDGALWRKWRGVEADMSKDKDVLERCKKDAAACPSYAAQFSRVIESVKSKSGRARLDEANRSVNLAIRYVSDMAQYGEADRWSSALSTFKTAQGDCEDYAIAKYVALTEAGVASEDLRIVLVRDRSIREDHAVLAAHLDGHWMILDNRRSELVEDNDIKSFTPLFAINYRGVQLFATPYARRDGDADALPAADAGATEWSGQESQSVLTGAMPGELPLLM
jgi:predicted transglutaminase-like cysteine proteinase